MRPCAVATWEFGECGVVEASKLLSSGSSSVDAVEHGVRAVELDESVTSVGYGGLPNIDGVLQLDCGFMCGDGRCGTVMALEGYRSSVGIARRVMERSRHTALAGAGAQQFAVTNGFVPEKNEDLLTDYAKRRVTEEREKLVKTDPRAAGHTDTVGLISLDESGHISVACATSGMQFKDAGRVGDSPFVGAGLFADDAVGAATATGDGDQMIRFCLSFLIVELMRTGKTPTEACKAAIERVAAAEPDCQAAVIAMDLQGQIGYASTRSNFVVIAWNPTDGLTKHQSDPALPQWKRKCI